ncbi:16S rRNA (uracil(1498)-N(3))-methyltransferase [bacterium]|nr:16S rRNA (uracil(1498)-N(3))-methyltransferase [bacterium]
MPHRYYFDGPLLEGTTIHLAKDELKHLKNVMRTKKGAEIEIINGKGALGKATFAEEIILYEVLEQKTPVEKGLALALTEPKVLELAIEKATEVGITAFYIFPSHKSKLKVLSDNKRDRIEKILVSAMKQSKRLFLPTIEFLSKKEELPKKESYLLADFNGESYEKSPLAQTFIIGPESGFSREEIAFFKEELGARGVLLSDAVLRAETAAICAAHLLSLC